jgi:ketosteroid isomerase-like protein
MAVDWSSERNVQTVRRFYAAGPSDDDTDRVPFLAEDAVWHVPGRNHVSGRYDGIEAITQEISRRMAGLSEWHVEPVDVMANDDLVMATGRLVAASGDRRLESVGGHVFRFNPDGRIIEVWGFVRDQAALDELLGG